jgi:branched-chain amino acid transport system substrate-binding protein
MAPNYPAGKDALTGYRRLYKGEVAGEVYTKLGQNDYAAEIAQIRASGADSVFFFLPGGMGIAFMKQYAQSGVGLPMIGPGFSFDQDILGAVGEAALGAKNTSQWSKDIDNETNKAFVASFKAEYKRLPSLYASQGFDTANLLLSALAKAKVSDADAFRKALEAADFKSTRGAFKFGPNHHPIQDIYVREVIKEEGVFTNKIIGVALKDHADAYAAECKM